MLENLIKPYKRGKWYWQITESQGNETKPPFLDLNTGKPILYPVLERYTANYSRGTTYTRWGAKQEIKRSIKTIEKMRQHMAQEAITNVV